MAGVPSEATAQKIATETAESFVKSFYRSADNQVQRSNLSNYFVEKSTESEHTFPFINYNGSVLDATDFQKMVEEFPPTSFDIDSCDAQVLNAALKIQSRSDEDAKRGKNLSIVILVSGTLHLGRKEEDNKRLLSDVFVLVPNPKVGSGRRERGQKDWLVESYNSRIVGT